jgi:hypothetical protein
LSSPARGDIVVEHRATTTANRWQTQIQIIDRQAIGAAQQDLVAVQDVGRRDKTVVDVTFRTGTAAASTPQQQNPKATQ